MSADSIVQRLELSTRNRDHALQSYTAFRQYRAAGQRTEAELQAVVEFQSPDVKRFRIVSEEGSGIIRRSVFRGMMDAESDAQRTDRKRRSALTRENYRFTYAGEATRSGRRCYVLDAEPLRDEKYLFRGRVWVDMEEFAVVRIEGRPARMPSFWTKRIEFVREFQKVGDFWLPVRDESITQVRFVGEKTVTIDHSDYKLEPRPVRASNVSSTVGRRRGGLN